MISTKAVAPGLVGLLLLNGALACGAPTDREVTEGNQDLHGWRSNAAENLAARIELARTMHSRVIGEAAIIGQHRVRTGRYHISTQGGAPHEIHLTTKTVIQKGDGDNVVELVDATAGVTAKLTFSDESASHTIEIAGVQQAIQANPDGTMSVDGVVFEDGPSAASHLSTGAAIQAMPLELKYAAIDAFKTLAADGSVSSKGAVVAVVADFFVAVVAAIIESIPDYLEAGITIWQTVTYWMNCGNDCSYF